MPTPVAFTQFEPSLALPGWMRLALWFTTGLNLLGAIIFLPVSEPTRAQFGLPPAHPLYLWIIALFIGIIGLGYGYSAWTNRASPVFIAVGAAGKIAFFAAVAVCWSMGALPFTTFLLSGTDLLLGCLFIGWLIQANRVRN